MILQKGLDITERCDNLLNFEDLAMNCYWRTNIRVILILSNVFIVEGVFVLHGWFLGVLLLNDCLLSNLFVFSMFGWLGYRNRAALGICLLWLNAIVQWISDPLLVIQLIIQLIFQLIEWVESPSTTLQSLPWKHIIYKRTIVEFPLLRLKKKRLYVKSIPWI